MFQGKVKIKWLTKEALSLTGDHCAHPAFATADVTGMCCVNLMWTQELVHTPQAGLTLISLIKEVKM
jgi:hypothetical protein